MNYQNYYLVIAGDLNGKTSDSALVKSQFLLQFRVFDGNILFYAIIGGLILKFSCGVTLVFSQL